VSIRIPTTCLEHHRLTFHYKLALLIASSGDIESAYAKLEGLESTMPLFSNEVGGHFVFIQNRRFQLAYLNWLTKSNRRAN
jgi:hypothetical protein